MTNSPVVTRVFGGSMTGKWFVHNGLEKPYGLYLHTDGEWRKSTLHNGIYSGYFDTKPSALDTLARVQHK